jgi:hypothetical protein
MSVQVEEGRCPTRLGGGPGTKADRRTISTEMTNRRDLRAPFLRRHLLGFAFVVLGLLGIRHTQLFF